MLILKNWRVFIFEINSFKLNVFSGAIRFTAKDEKIVPEKGSGNISFEKLLKVIETEESVNIQVLGKISANCFRIAIVVPE